MSYIVEFNGRRFRCIDAIAVNMGDDQVSLAAVDGEPEEGRWYVSFIEVAPGCWRELPITDWTWPG